MGDIIASESLMILDRAVSIFDASAVRNRLTIGTLVTLVLVGDILLPVSAALHASSASSVTVRGVVCVSTVPLARSPTAMTL